MTAPNVEIFDVQHLARTRYKDDVVSGWPVEYAFSDEGRFVAI